LLRETRSTRCSCGVFVSIINVSPNSDFFSPKFDPIPFSQKLQKFHEKYIKKISLVNQRFSPKSDANLKTKRRTRTRNRSFLDPRNAASKNNTKSLTRNQLDKPTIL